MVEVFVFLFWAFIFCACFYAIFLLIRAIDSQQTPKVGKPTSHRYISQPHQNQDSRKQKQKNSPAAKQPVSSKVQNQLLNLVNGDMKAANRLLEHTRKTNPHQPEQWVWEKVIYDLERDRRI
ncbi:MAG: hypothetical protein KME27_01510 [Lyngbya sp. HA4199-MV5]|jgi:uncharacterized iron-regulated membrane protein|nr:hypothetical protein [Lyngbya sp. HA4199-MV5]